ncbi:MAG: hypothetical protein GOVbin1709_58 [Prokaryotic dsDNA virus sp.]|nr:MAG: hypothetical protein GOVbin1709_58 [Prokaryotic dsDNA virus sp.]|tara:strand:+ start:9135 stop:9380 length:246 start_codon:yes stop_codon:yes gene_type:complete
MKETIKKLKKNKITKKQFREELQKMIDFQKYILNLIDNDMKKFNKITGLDYVPYDKNGYIDIIKIESCISKIKIKHIKFKK